jgi:hypothetical protein
VCGVYSKRLDMALNRPGVSLKNRGGGSIGNSNTGINRPHWKLPSAVWAGGSTAAGHRCRAGFALALSNGGQRLSNGFQRSANRQPGCGPGETAAGGWPLLPRAAKLTKPGARLTQAVAGQTGSGGSAHAAKPCQNPAKPPWTAAGFAGFRGSFAQVSRQWLESR